MKLPESRPNTRDFISALAGTALGVIVGLNMEHRFVVQAQSEEAAALQAETAALQAEAIALRERDQARAELQAVLDESVILTKTVDTYKKLHAISEDLVLHLNKTIEATEGSLRLCHETQTSKESIISTLSASNEECNGQVDELTRMVEMDIPVIEKCTTDINNLGMCKVAVAECEDTLQAVTTNQPKKKGFGLRLFGTKEK